MIRDMPVLAVHHVPERLLRAKISGLVVGGGKILKPRNVAYT
jgi:hypothetical protein